MVESLYLDFNNERFHPPDTALARGSQLSVGGPYGQLPADGCGGRVARYISGRLEVGECVKMSDESGDGTEVRHAAPTVRS